VNALQPLARALATLVDVRRLVLAWAAVIAVLTAAFPAAPGVGTEAAVGAGVIASGDGPANAGPWRLSWHQEFAGRKGARLDPRQRRVASASGRRARSSSSEA
jgi:hypothetical protein